ncbi:hypothetical protein I4U23_022530 [Adineta vaga]|nr:hypothetical protein I4U23_022530 [Adineta vaga]
MELFYYFVLWMIIRFINYGSAMKLKLSSQASWNQNGITVIGSKNGQSGSSLSELHHPRGITITDKDVLYICDTYNNRIIIVHLDSSIATFAIGSGQGTNLVGLSQPSDVFILNSSLYVLELIIPRVQKMSLNGSNPTTLSHITGLLSPTHFYIDNNGDIYASSYVSHSVFVFRSNSSTGSRVAGNGFLGSTNQHLNEPYGIFVKDVGVIYIADCGNHRIMKWLSGASSGIRVAGDGTPGSKSTQLNSPIDIIVDENEYMYIVEYGNSRVTRWSPNSSLGICIVACSGEAGVQSTQLKEPRSLSFDRSGSLYVSDQGNHRIQKRTNQNLDVVISLQIVNFYLSNNQPKLIVNAKWSQCAITFIDNNSLSSQARGIFIDYKDNIYLSDYSKNQILIFSGQSIIPQRRLNAKLYDYTTLFVTLNGDIYFANGNRTGQIDKITPNSTQSQFVTNFTENCFGLFIDIQNYLYCSMRDKHQVEKMLLDGNNQTIMRIAGTGSQGSQSNQLNGPWGIFVDIHFDLYVADAKNNRIQYCNPPIIQLVPSGMKLKFRHNQYFYISSNIENQCKQSESILIEWKILSCSFSCIYETKFDKQIDFSNNDLYIPSGILTYGVYHLELTVTMINFPTIKSSSFIEIEIIPSNIVINFLSYETRTIEHNYEENLVFNPGEYSYDLDSIQFNRNEWHYKYYYRIYSINLQEFRTIEDLNRTNQSKILDKWIYNNINNSSLTIFNKSFEFNETYQFLIEMIHHQNSSLQSFAYLFVEIVNMTSSNIIINCITRRVCSLKDEIYYINQNNQLELSSFSTRNHSKPLKITWNIYQGTLNKTIQWISFTPLPISLFFGLNTANLLVMSDLFILTIEYWRFQVIYEFESERIENHFDMKVNNGPKNGFCSINPLNGTVLTLFTINCTNWFDQDEIKDYLIYGLTKDSKKRSINGLLQNRMEVLQADLIESSQIFSDENELYFQNFNYQKQIANEITHEINDIISSATSILHIHLYLNQQFIVNSSSILFTLEKIESSFISHRLNESEIHFPLNLIQLNSTCLLRIIKRSLASFGNNSDQLYTNFSQLFSLSILDENENNIEMKTNFSNRMEFFIPRAPKYLISSMFYQNVTEIKKQNVQFHFYLFNLTEKFSIHFEIFSLKLNISYLLIYQFDRQPKLNSRENWILFCPSNLTNEKMFIHFLDNQQTLNHHSIIYGIRELTINEEINQFCCNEKVSLNLFKINQPRSFSSDYQIRLYQSNCFYFDKNNQWKSDGLLVGPLTNHYQTQCFSTHL